MIRKMEAMDHDVVMDIWLHGNLAAHSFLSPTYWKSSMRWFLKPYKKQRYMYMRRMVLLWGLSDYRIRMLRVSL